MGTITVNVAKTGIRKLGKESEKFRSIYVYIYIHTCVCVCVICLSRFTSIGLNYNKVTKERNSLWHVLLELRAEPFQYSPCPPCCHSHLGCRASLQLAPNATATQITQLHSHRGWQLTTCTLPKSLNAQCRKGSWYSIAPVSEKSDATCQRVDEKLYTSISLVHPFSTTRAIPTDFLGA